MDGVAIKAKIRWPVLRVCQDTTEQFVNEYHGRLGGVIVVGVQGTHTARAVPTKRKRRYPVSRQKNPLEIRKLLFETLCDCSDVVCYRLHTDKGCAKGEYEIIAPNGKPHVVWNKIVILEIVEEAFQKRTSGPLGCCCCASCGLSDRNARTSLTKRNWAVAKFGPAISNKRHVVTATHTIVLL